MFFSDLQDGGTSRVMVEAIDGIPLARWRGRAVGTNQQLQREAHLGAGFQPARRRASCLAALLYSRRQLAGWKPAP